MKTLNKVFAFLFSTVVIGYIVNIIAGKYGWDLISNNPWISIFFLSLLTNIYFILHLNIIYSKIPDNDIETLRKILSYINKNDMEFILHKYSSNIGFNLETTISVEKLIDAYEHIDNKVYHKKTAKLLNNFITSLKNYFNLYGRYSYTENNIVKIFPEMKINNPEKYNSLIKDLDKLADKAYINFQRLLDFIKLKGHTIFN